jgi:hypothetical protein
MGRKLGGVYSKWRLKINNDKREYLNADPSGNKWNENLNSTEFLNIEMNNRKRQISNDE